MIAKYILSLSAIGFASLAFFPYIFTIIKGKTRPHVFSWVIWAISMVTVFAAQVSDGAGVGSWAVGYSGLMSVIIAVLAYFKKGDIHITTTDWMFFILSVCGIPIWILTSDPLWAVVLMTTIDVLAYFPTLRKCYLKPYDENVFTFFVLFIRNVFIIFALEAYTITTVLCPAVICVMLLLAVIFIKIRRYKLLYAS